MHDQAADTDGVAPRRLPSWADASGLARLRAIEHVELLERGLMRHDAVEYMLATHASATHATCADALTPPDGRSFLCQYLHDKALVPLRAKQPPTRMGSVAELVGFGLDRALGLYRVPNTVLHHATRHVRIMGMPLRSINSVNEHPRSDIVVQSLVGGVREIKLATPRGARAYLGADGSPLGVCLPYWAATGVAKPIGTWWLRGERYSVEQLTRPQPGAAATSPPTFGACDSEHCRAGGGMRFGPPNRASCACVFDRREERHMALPCTLATTRALLDLATYDHLLKNRDRLHGGLKAAEANNVHVRNLSWPPPPAAAAVAHGPDDPLEGMVYIDQHASSILGQAIVPGRGPLQGKSAEEEARRWAYAVSTSHECVFSATIGAVLFGDPPAGWGLGGAAAHRAGGWGWRGAAAAGLNASGLVGAVLGWAQLPMSRADEERVRQQVRPAIEQFSSLTFPRLLSPSLTFHRLPSQVRPAIEQQLEHLIDRYVECAGGDRSRWLPGGSSRARRILVL